MLKLKKCNSPVDSSGQLTFSKRCRTRFFIIRQFPKIFCNIQFSTGFGRKRTEFTDESVKFKLVIEQVYCIFCHVSHNRSVYAQTRKAGLTPPGGADYATARSFRFAQTFGPNIPTPLLRHSLAGTLRALLSDKP
jgi:hypothetical protein